MECNVSELVKRGHDQVAELKASCGAVDVRDVAQLISDLATQLDVQLARSNSLAAENAGLKEALWWLYETVSSDGVSIPDEKYSSVTNAAQVLSETPATDAFLTEMRAQGVEMFAKEMHADISGDDAREFAAQLRKGAAS